MSLEETKTNRDVLDNLQGKLVSGFYLHKINTDGKEFEVYEKDKEQLVLLCKTGKIEDGGDGIAVRLPLPLRFDEKWFIKYKGLNLSTGSIISYNLEGFIKNKNHFVNFTGATFVLATHVFFINKFAGRHENLFYCKYSLEMKTRCNE